LELLLPTPSPLSPAPSAYTHHPATVFTQTHARARTRARIHTYAQTTKPQQTTRTASAPAPAPPLCAVHTAHLLLLLLHHGGDAKAVNDELGRLFHLLLGGPHLALAGQPPQHTLPKAHLRHAHAHTGRKAEDVKGAAISQVQHGLKQGGGGGLGGQRSMCYPRCRSPPGHMHMHMHMGSEQLATAVMGCRTRMRMLINTQRCTRTRTYAHTGCICVGG